MRRLQQRLAIWMNGIPVGYWEKHRGEDRLEYHPDWITDSQGRPLSLSLPFTPGNQPYRGSVVRDYFDNLLPDSEGIRRRLAMRYHAESLDPFDLLAELGRDCVGAIQLLDIDEQPAQIFSIRQRPLSEAQIAEMLRNTAAVLPGQHGQDDDLRLSIAGAQEKTALLWHDNQWCLPEGNTPTTHIFKLALGLVGNMRADMSTSIENEWLCSLILEHYGVPVARTAIAQFEDQKALIVERFTSEEISVRWWPWYYRYYGRSEPFRSGCSRSQTLFQSADYFLAAGCHRWPCKEFQSCAFTTKSLPPNATVRCVIRVASDWPG